MNKHQAGNVFKIINDEARFTKDSIVKIVRDDADDSPLCELVAGSCEEGSTHDNQWYVHDSKMEPIYLQEETKPEPFKPFDVIIHIDSEDKARQLYTVANTAQSRFTGIDRGSKGIEPEYGLLLDTFRLLASKLKEIR